MNLSLLAVISLCVKLSDNKSDMEATKLGSAAEEKMQLHGTGF